MILLAFCTASAQTEAPRLTFEAASVKPAAPPAPGQRFVPLHGGPGTNSPGQLTGTASLQWLATWAYGVKGYRLSGPAWMESEMFEIAAKIPAGTTKDQLALMLQSLLVDRFHLVAHHESREMATYALKVAKGGAKLKESDPEAAAKDEAAEATRDYANTPRPRVTRGADGFPEVASTAGLPGNFVLTLAGGEFTRTKMFARHQTMEQLADSLSAWAKGPVVDQTELKGQYDFTLGFESDPPGGIPANAPSSAVSPDGAPPSAPDHGATLFAALQGQLGLRLESRKGPVDVLVIDRVDRTPTEN